METLALLGLLAVSVVLLDVDARSFAVGYVERWLCWVG